jgi:hypothetical protein
MNAEAINDASRIQIRVSLPATGARISARCVATPATMTSVGATIERNVVSNNTPAAERIGVELPDADRIATALNERRHTLPRFDKA